jgi:hypothetical protein
MKTTLKSFVVCLLSTGVIQATIIKVPADHPTIQAGIDAAANGDTVLVSTGKYLENINFKGKNIVVGSMFLTTGDTSYISQTVIDGNKRGTVVTFDKGENDAAALTGFTITNGQGKDQAPTGAWPYDYIGGGITCRNNSNPRLVHLRIIGNTAPFGGGICIRESKPELEDVLVYKNKAAHTGGGIYCYYGSSPIFKNMTIAGNAATFWGGGVSSIINSTATFKNVFISENIADEGGGIYCFDNSSPRLEKTTVARNIAFERGGGILGDDAIFARDNSNRCNIYSNYSGIGSDLCFPGSSKISVIVDTFTVLNPSNDFASPLSMYTFDILHGKIEQVEHDLYVSPNGNDANGGQSPSDPLHSISLALSKILADSIKPHTMFLAEGVYKPSSGEHFPLNMHDYVSLTGESEKNVILDAEGQGGVLCFYLDRGITVESLSITGGSAYAGGAANCISSNPILRNLTVYKNAAVNYGGGVYCNSSSPTLTKVKIFENTASWGGGGIFCVGNSSPILESVTISRNTAKYWGGAVYSESNSNPTLTNSILWNNVPHEIRLLSGSVTIEYSDVKGGKGEIINDNSDWLNEGAINWLEGNIDVNPLFCNPLSRSYTLAENSPCKATGKNGTNMGALGVGCGPIVIVENPSVLYVSVNGSDQLGSGSYDNPFATIQHALDFAASGDTILVYPGTYFEKVNFSKRDIALGSFFLTTGDTSYISKTIIDGDTSGTVVSITNGDSTSILSGFTITNGKAGEGGGIYCFNSSPTLSGLRVIRNRSGAGGGINASDSRFKLVNSLIADNTSSVFGGGIYLSASYPILSNVTIRDNFAEGSGGGCVFSSSVPQLKNVTISENTAHYNGGGISMQFSSAVFDSIKRCNIYLNHAGRGSDIDFFDFEEGNANIILFADTFTVKYPTDYHVYRIDKFNILHGKLDQSKKDLYVSPYGTNDNSGESPSEPLRTISHALSMIEADSMNPRTIHISDGEYSPSETGDHFPLNMVDYVSLKGENSDKVILNARGKSGVLSFDSDTGNYVENVTLTGGQRFEGGGIWCAHSSPGLTNVAITGNKAMAGGGGMNCSENSHPNLENCTISSNKAEYGGGIAFYGSCASLLNTILWGNSPDEIYFQGLGSPRSCVEISYTDVKDSTKRIITNSNGDVYWRAGNLDANPLFCKSDSGNYSLAENSPCVGAGKEGKNIGAFRVGCGPMEVDYRHVGLPINFELSQNFPNPFNPCTMLQYGVPITSRVRLQIYNVLGQVVAELINGEQAAGWYRIQWNANVSTGIYFYRIDAVSLNDPNNRFVQVKKMLLLK